jgi:hypothetical protein
MARICAAALPLQAKRSRFVPAVVSSLVACALLLSLPARGQAGQTIQVANGDVAGLITAIKTLNANGGGAIDLASGGAYSVIQPSDWWYGPNAFPAISSVITINGNGATISRASPSPKFPSGYPKFRLFYVSGGFSTLPAGSLSLNNLTLTGGLAQGGSGGLGLGGGGGGAGLGGAIYNQGTLSLSSVTLTGNAAHGGSAGAGNAENYAGGAGGGLGGNGADSNGGDSAGGGGGGFQWDGAIGPDSGFGGSGGSFLGNEGGGNGNAGTSIYGGNGGNGLQCGAGGGGGFEVGENGGVASPQGSGADFRYEGGSGAQGGGQGGTSSDGGTGCGGGGGAFGGGGGGGYGAGTSNGAGGAGGVGGGGGGGGFNGGGGSGGFGGGGSGGAGTSFVGNGGFGGGGGGSYFNAGTAAGTSTFGGGAGISSAGTTGMNGGGGAGFGGAIFNHLGTANIVSSVFTSNSAAGASGGGTANGFGGAIFNLNGTVLLSGITFSGNTAVDSGSNADGGAFVYNLSHNAGNASASQTAEAGLLLIDTTISTTNGDLTNNQVNGTATVTTSAPVASLDQSALSFGSYSVDSPIPAQSVTLVNFGNATLSISNVSLTGSGQFSIAGNTCESTLGAGASCQVTLALSSTMLGTFTGQLTFTDNTFTFLGSTQAVSLSGVTVQQSAVTQLVFGTAPPANVWPGWNLPNGFTVIEETAGGVRNYSAADLIGLVIDGPGGFSKTYAVNASDGIATFNMSGTQLTAAGTYTYRAFISGGSVTQATATQTVAGGTVGSASPASTITLTFTAGGTLQTIAVLTQGAPNLDFASSSGGTCATGTAYTIGQTCTLNVTFTPTVAGMRYGAAVLQDGSGNPLATAYFQGEGFGPQIDYLPGAQATVVDSTAVGQAEGVAVDGAGNVYVVDESNYALLKSSFSAGSYSVNTVPASTPSGTNGVAVDGAGNIYFNDFGNNRILKEMPAGGSYIESAITSSDLLDPCGVAVDGAGIVYVADSGSNQIYKETPSGNTYTESTVPVSNPTYPSVTCGVAVDGSGNVYISDVYNVRLLKETLSGGSYTESTLPIPSGFAPNGVAVDAVGNVYFFISGINQATPEYAPVYKDTLSSSGYTLSTVPTSGICYPAGVAVDGYGNVYVSDGGGCIAGALKEDFADPPTLSFPTPTPVGSTDTADGAQTESILNIGNQPLDFTTPTTGDNPSYPANFPVSSADTNLCSSGKPLAAGASCDVSMVFVPAGGGANTGSSVLTDNALNATGAVQTIGLSGVGTNGPQTIAFPTIATQTAATTLNLSASATSGLAVSFASLTTTVCTVSSSVASFISYGHCTIQATQAGNADFLAAAPVSQTFSVGHGSQTITFPQIASQVAATTINLSATASSGLPVSFETKSPTICTVSGTTASLIAAGFCYVQAMQPGNNEYLGAINVTVGFGVGHASQTISFPAITGSHVAATTLNLSATASSGLPVSFASTTPTICTVSGTTASLIAEGFCTIQATQNGNNSQGNSEYFVANPVFQTFGIGHASQTISFPAIGNKTAATTVNLAATASSGLPVSFASATPTVCTVSGVTASLIAEGFCYINATQAGNNEYFAAPTVGQQFGVGHAAQTIAYSPSGPLVAASTVNLDPVATSGLPVTLTSTSPSVCTVSGTSATLLTYGFCNVTASVGGNKEYFSATVGHSFGIGHASQTITFPAIPSQAVGTPLTLSATASSGLAVTFTSTAQTICKVSGTTASFLAVGTCTIEASQPGNATYSGAVNVSRSFTVAE